MALPTGSGTETLHSHIFQDVDAAQTLIFGVQHHVYTVLSIIVYCNALNATTDIFDIKMKGHDGHAGVENITIVIARGNIQAEETYVWNDKFSFNGCAPASTNVLSASEQVAIAAQTSTNVQELQFGMSSTADDFDIIVTYLDQDWT